MRNSTDDIYKQIKSYCEEVTLASASHCCMPFNNDLSLLEVLLFLFLRNMDLYLSQMSIFRQSLVSYQGYFLNMSAPIIYAMIGLSPLHGPV